MKSGEEEWRLTSVTPLPIQVGSNNHFPDCGQTLTFFLHGKKTLVIVFLGVSVVLQAVVLTDLLGVDQLAVAYGMVLAAEGVACLMAPAMAGKGNGNMRTIIVFVRYKRLDLRTNCQSEFFYF